MFKDLDSQMRLNDGLEITDTAKDSQSEVSDYRSGG